MSAQGASGEVAGRALDAQVAEKIFGCKVKYYTNAIGQHEPVPECSCSPRQHGDILNLPPYSTDIAAAWLVVEKLITQRMCPVVWARVDGQWVCQVMPPPEVISGSLADVEADTAAEAICRAALLAVEAKRS